MLALVVFISCAPEEKRQASEPPKPEEPPAAYKVKFETTKGDFVIQVTREWAPRGSDQFFELVRNRFYDGARFFRVVRNFVVQFGISGDPAAQRLWGDMKFRDDPVKQSNKKGFVSFAQLGPNSRTTQAFINLRDNPGLDKDGFAPFGQVVDGMDVVERLWSNYGEMAPRGSGPDPARLMKEGNAYLDERFPRLDSITRARLIRDSVQ
jgi:peptidyl-prolyl cis-trans isomerase A (cyclophilin A)